jgi:hypothetical protein
VSNRGVCEAHRLRSYLEEIGRGELTEALPNEECEKAAVQTKDTWFFGEGRVRRRRPFSLCEDHLKHVLEQQW